MLVRKFLSIVYLLSLIFIFSSLIYGLNEYYEINLIACIFFSIFIIIILYSLMMVETEKILKQKEFEKSRKNETPEEKEKREKIEIQKRLVLEQIEKEKRYEAELLRIEEEKQRKKYLQELERKEIRNKILARERKKQLEKEVLQDLIDEGKIIYLNENRENIPPYLKKEIWVRDNGKCVMCGSNENLEFDHIIPISKGGATSYRNLQLLCQKCNRTKSDKIE